MKKKDIMILIFLFFVSCIPGIGMLILWSMLGDVDYGAGMIMSLLTFVAWCIPIMFVLMLDFSREENIEVR